MCDKCLAIIENAPRVYRRPLTAIELEWGDVDNVRDQMEASEEGVVKIAKPVLVKIVAQLVDEYRPLVERGDIAGVARVSPSFTGDLAQALRVAQQSAVTRGKRQVLTMAKKAGVRLAAKRPVKDPAKAAAYLEARSEAMSEQIQAQIAASVKRTVLGAAAVGEWDDEIAETIANTATRSLVASAIEVAREAFAVGRLYGYEEIKEDVAYVVYTAVLDDSVCEVCEALDQTQYDDPDEGFEAAPNAECLGGIERCRCYPIAVMRR